MRKTYNRQKANLGRQLERLIDATNNQYRNKGFADIRKIPTPVQIKGNNRGTITGKLLKGEWVDYVGIYAGRAIIFDAKETSSATSFPLSNIPDHQYELLRSWRGKGAVAFIIVQFTKKHEEIYILQFSDLEDWWEQSLEGMPPKKIQTEEKEETISRDVVDHFILSGLAPDYDGYHKSLVEILQRHIKGESYLKLATEFSLSSHAIVEQANKYRMEIAPLAKGYADYVEKQGGENE